MHITYLVVLLCAAATSTFAYARDKSSKYGASEMDGLRAELVSAVDVLTSKVLDPRWHEVNDTNAPGADVAVAKAFDTYVENLKKSSQTYETWYRDTAVKTWWVWTMLDQDLNNVDKLFGSFSRFVRHQANERVPSPREEWLDLAKTLSVASKNYDKIHKVVIHGRLYHQVLLESKNHLCELQMSPQQIVYNTYNTITLAEIKIYAMSQFSWLMMKVYGEGNFEDEVKKTRETYETRTSLEVVTALNSMGDASKILWRCDPTLHEEGKTYVAFTRLLQGYIENEVDMNDENTCRENCAHYQVAKNYGCYKDQFCSRQPLCSGKILSCRYVDSDMWICPGSKTSTRRYEWIEYENGRTLGKKSICTRGTTKVDSWWRLGIYHCSYCMCLCDEPSPKSDRFVSMDEITSDVARQKVVTGIRFVKLNRVVYMQISEGRLMPQGKIDQDSVAWSEVKPKDFKYSVRGKDYHEMSNEERAIDLDNLEGPPGYAMTGLRFRKLGAHLNFEVQVTPFDFATGRLDSAKHLWISNDNTDAYTEKPRIKINIYSPDVPTSVSVRSEVQSNSDQFVKFTHSDFDKDAAQSTVPYLDAQPVRPNIHVPLSGAGLYYKTSWGSGGFIGPKIITYDYSKHVTDYFPLSTKLDEIVN